MLACCRAPSPASLDRTQKHVCACVLHHEKGFRRLTPCRKPNFVINTCICELDCVHVISILFFLTRTAFLGLCKQPIPHFLLFLLVWLWGLCCRDNRRHGPVSRLFAKFLLLQAYCTFAARIGKSLAPPSPTHTSSHTCRAWRSSQKCKGDLKLPVISTGHFRLRVTLMIWCDTCS